MKAAVPRRRIEVPAQIRDRAAAVCAQRGVSMREWLADLIACALEAEAGAPIRRRRHRPTYLRAIQ